ncbi:hypothetical protein JAAARDRAFT_198302 [Jaapia argillacea MUCL 33604]|uniref:F-box domain-containing protein n=1 Tax=Jaapia argillacea MUCL 33604 TaxID=933084 RepID=A0A067PM79_9AGAM|nr:hypothetical protein JAAARDRAFT_198302 [Jaapia argillacea MUCL 33604]
MSEQPIAHPSLLSSSLDILPLIFAYLDRPTLLSASQANKTFNTFSNKPLYSSVIFSPKWRNPTYPWKDKGLFQCQFQSAFKPHISPHIQRLTITGHLSSYSSVPTTLLSSLHISILSFTSLQLLLIIPINHLPDQFVPLLLGLANGSLQRLRELELNTSCFVESGEFEYRLRVPLGGAVMEEDKDEDGVDGEENREAEMKNESTINESLPTWLTHLSPTLHEFHFKGNCGSITLGILRFLSTSLSSPSTNHSEKSEWSHARTRGVDCLLLHATQSPHLIPNLPSLCKLTIKYTGTPISSTTQASLFTSFILRLVKKSRCLQVLNIVHDVVGGGVKMDGLVSSLVSQEGRSAGMKELRLWFISRVTFEELCRGCTELEVLVAGIGEETLQDLPNQIAPLKHLHTLSLKTHFMKFSKHCDLFNIKAARDIMKMSNVRRLCVNGVAWKGQWEVCEGEVEIGLVEVRAGLVGFVPKADVNE